MTRIFGYKTSVFRPHKNKKTLKSIKLFKIVIRIIKFSFILITLIKNN